MDATGDRSRVYWQCRRGMRELDMLLQNFFATRYDDAEESVQQAFCALLEYPDQLLLEYLMGRLVPHDPAMSDVVARVRSAAQD
jgi:antitoxin CptB